MPATTFKIESFTFNPFSENTYVLYDDTKECVVIDPGCSNKTEQQELQDFIKTNELKVVRLLNTHCHIDHVLGNKFVADTYGVPLEIHEDDLPVLRSVPTYSVAYGFPQYQEILPEKFLKEGEDVAFGNTRLQVLLTPGHAPGHVVFYHAESQNVVGGDVLFQRSIGRTDLPGGDYDTLIQSIKTKLFILPDEVTVHPGHGPSTTIGEEKASNPFLR
ncbi:metallo-beta-lactamase [Rufibacter radiotolerans]|uniref:Metallo-beta-lactamase n=1 Tax=Rufibacter radiotolerans TaxID=1379910 RepID=A0A0H4VFJ9_9BACT|nr:MBL fold metallo-hydrolase [Rufibacter radiotolerans]AKQ44390.1 metallo-beta-lactamase [Rufibacter radiotolerans]